MLPDWVSRSRHGGERQVETDSRGSEVANKESDRESTGESRQGESNS
jgi:hypothetical protein